MISGFQPSSFLIFVLSMAYLKSCPGRSVTCSMRAYILSNDIDFSSEIAVIIFKSSSLLFSSQLAPIFHLSPAGDFLIMLQTALL